MEIQLDECTVRSFRETDAASLARHANNRNVWINLRDAFPNPYSVADARRFIEAAIAAKPATRFAVAVEDEAVGAIGFALHQDVERVSAEIGYWLGEAFWGRGIMTEVVRAMTAYAVETHELTRVYALPFQWNQASFRVLEKAGYMMEGRLRRSAIKDGKIIDQFLYAHVVTG